MMETFTHCTILLTLATGSVTGQTWTPHNTSSLLEFKLMRKAVNSTTASAMTHSQSLASCAHLCTQTSPASRATSVSFYYVAETHECYCYSDVDDVDDVDLEREETQTNIIYGTLKTSIKLDKTANQHKRTTLWPQHQDCYTFYVLFATPLVGIGWVAYQAAILPKEGVYLIYPGEGSSVDVWCDLLNGGFSVIQKRIGGVENFHRNWSQYVTGFGDKTGEYWIGLRDLHRMANKSDLVLRIDPPEDVAKPWYFYEPYSDLEYFGVDVGNASTNYAFQHTFFTSIYVCVSDAVRGHYTLPFSTFDHDNDDSDERNLANETRSGWWIGNLTDVSGNSNPSWWIGNVSSANPNCPYTSIGGNDSAARKLFTWPTRDYGPMPVENITMRIRPGVNTVDSL